MKFIKQILVCISLVIPAQAAYAMQTKKTDHWRRSTYFEVIEDIKTVEKLKSIVAELGYALPDQDDREESRVIDNRLLREKPQLAINSALHDVEANLRGLRPVLSNIVNGNNDLTLLARLIIRGEQLKQDVQSLALVVGDVYERKTGKTRPFFLWKSYWQPLIESGAVQLR